MTIAEYMSPELFSLTTQEGLDINQQIMLDSINYQELEQARQRSEPLSDHERAVARELDAKNASRESVMRQLQRQQGVGTDPDARMGNPQTANGAPLL